MRKIFVTNHKMGNYFTAAGAIPTYDEIYMFYGFIFVCSYMIKLMEESEKKQLIDVN